MLTKFDYQNLSGRRLPVIFTNKVKRLLKKVEQVTGKSIAEVNVVILTPQAIKKLNYAYRGYNTVTDILSFNYNDGQLVKGELFICLEQARRQAKILKSDILEELAFLFVHGCLHLLGFDHVTPADSMRMKKMEKRILFKDNSQ
jgi:probable rRNA maturation factor